MTNAPPSVNPSNEDSLAGVLRTAISKTLQGTDTMLPARVVAYDRATNRATVQPLIMVGTTTGAKVSRAQVASVPVFQYAGGGFVLSFPIVPGDLGWVKANDRDISLFLQSLSEEWPNTARARSFSDGVFFPDRLRDFTLDPADADRAVVQSSDGTVRVSVGASDVEITAGTSRVVVGASSVTVEADSVAVTAPLTTFTGAVTITGALSADGGVTGSGGIALETHKHSDVTAGAAETGGPVP